ncbi:MAG TPA: ribonuclease catalytic domain-containing protein [Burkholderiaceae bacterium]|nr:ribonuclease catalytic domain-containing protein [Burkholderiaceae bacterium]
MSQRRDEHLFRQDDVTRLGGCALLTMSQNLLFEEDGAFKAGAVLSATDAHYQVELASGKRSKVKSANVLLRFEQPPPGQLLAAAQRDAESIELDFLWECAPQEEFGFADLAREYYGRTPTPVEAATILLRLHSAPVYFHRKGRGRFRPAPPDILKAALAAVERKRQQQEKTEALTADLLAGRAPEPIARQAIALLTRPDRNSVEFKALENAAHALHMNPLRLLLERGAIASPLRWHLDSFFATMFPRGVGFAPGLPAPEQHGSLPLARVTAFSIDDSSTTEIDDAFSLQQHAGRTVVGIHIAAPAASISRDHPLDGVARNRMSTVYAPGLKVTMLPGNWIDAYSLIAGREVPVLSLYVDVDPDSATTLKFETRLERVRIAANLRHDQLDDIVTNERIAGDGMESAGVPFGRELTFLWRLANALLAERERVRGKPEPLGRIEHSIDVERRGEELDPDAHVVVRTRRRGAPLDLIVAELMILANSHWGGWLADCRRVGIYRSQSLTRIGGRAAGKVRMSTTPAPHEGIGVAHYAWSSSPLRRYVDLVNQRQLIAAISGASPPYATNDADLLAVVSAFDVAYAAYAAFQTNMERYWCLRWMKQERIARIAATVLKEDILRLDGLPFVTRVPGIPVLPRGQRVELDVLGADEIELTLEARLNQVLAATAEVEIETDESEEEAVQAQAIRIAQDETGEPRPPAGGSSVATHDPDRASGVAS